MLIHPHDPHDWVPSLCVCHPQACAQLVAEPRSAEVPYFDLCGKPRDDFLHRVEQK